MEKFGLNKDILFRLAFPRKDKMTQNVIFESFNPQETGIN